MVSLDALERAEKGDGVGRITRSDDGEGAALRLRDLSVTLDDGTAVVDDTDVAIMPGERVLVAGESGTGKSTLVRAIAGLWPWGEGRIEVQKGAKLMLLPQRPYIPIGTLRRAATYPDAADSRSVEEVAEAFKRVGLEHLVDRIDDEAPWDQTLSGGEKQRLAFARIFLHNPDIIVLDEATAALDPNSQDKLMELLAKQPEQTTLVSVGHRPELEAFHSRKIVLERRRGGAKLVSDIKLIRKPAAAACSAACCAGAQARPQPAGRKLASLGPCSGRSMRLIRLYIRVLSLLGSSARLAWVLAIANLALAATQFAEPVLFGRVVDALSPVEGRSAESWSRLLTLLMLWAAFGIFNIACTALVALHADRLSHSQRLFVLTGYYEHILQLTLAYHGGTHSGRLMKVMLQGTDSLWGLWLGFFRDQLAGFVSLLERDEVMLNRLGIPKSASF